MGKVDKEAFEDYLKETRSWETQRLSESNKSKKLAWCIAGASVVVGILGVASATFVATQEPAPPVVIRVDTSTGIVDVVNSIKDGKTNYQETVNKYFAQLYVRYREGYSNELKEEYYSSVGLMSAGVEQQKYFASFNPKNPQSPINVFGSYAKVKVQIKGTSFINPNVALVRYIKLIERGSAKPEISHWTATITFRYSGGAMKEKDRAVNPLGFQVTEYRNDPDAPGPDASTPTQPADSLTPAPEALLALPISTPLDTQPLSPVAPIVPAIQKTNQ